MTAYSWLAPHLWLQKPGYTFSVDRPHCLYAHRLVDYILAAYECFWSIWHFVNLAIVNASRSISIHICFGPSYQFFLSMYIRVKWLNHMVLYS